MQTISLVLLRPVVSFSVSFYSSSEHNLIRVCTQVVLTCVVPVYTNVRLWTSLSGCDSWLSLCTHIGNHIVNVIKCVYIIIFVKNFFGT